MKKRAAAILIIFAIALLVPSAIGACAAGIGAGEFAEAAGVGAGEFIKAAKLTGEAGYTKAAEAAARLPVIMYHSVSAGAAGPYVLPPETFVADIEYLERNGYTSVLPADVVGFVRHGRALPPRPIMLTFDDGHYNFLSTVLPVLKERGFKATVNVVGSYAERERGARVRSDYFSYLSPDEIAELAGYGSVAVGNHSFRLHSGMGAAPFAWEDYKSYRARLHADLGRCDELLRGCGARPDVYACPFGRYGGHTVRALGEAGYEIMLTCEEKVNLLSRENACAPVTLGRFNRPAGISTEKFFGRIERS